MSERSLNREMHLRVGKCQRLLAIGIKLSDWEILKLRLPMVNGLIDWPNYLACHRALFIHLFEILCGRRWVTMPDSGEMNIHGK